MKIKGNILRYAATVLTAALLAAYAMAAEPEGKSADFRFAYDVDFEMNFDNRELYKSRFSRSMTIFGARLTPSVGLAVRQKNGMSHKMMVGIDIMKDFGNSPVPPELTSGSSGETSERLNNTSLLRELTLYYRLDKRFGKTAMTMYAGIFRAGSPMKKDIQKHSSQIRLHSMTTILKDCS